MTTCNKPDCEFRPLEQFAGVTGLDVDDFMFMGTATVGTVVVSLFKHYDTRRYLNLDSAGHAYRYEYDSGETGTYLPLPSALDAVAWVLS